MINDIVVEKWPLTRHSIDCLKIECWQESRMVIGFFYRLVMARSRSTMEVKLNLLVLRCKNINDSRAFYEKLGMSFQQEKHGSGPTHYSVVLGDLVLELYPLNGKNSPGNSRLGFSLPCDGDLRVMLDREGIKVVPSYKFNQRLVLVVQDPDERKVEVCQIQP